VHTARSNFPLPRRIRPGDLLQFVKPTSACWSARSASPFGVGCNLPLGGCFSRNRVMAEDHDTSTSFSLPMRSSPNARLGHTSSGAQRGAAPGNGNKLLAIRSHFAASPSGRLDGLLLSRPSALSRVAGYYYSTVDFIHFILEESLYRVPRIGFVYC
jgi:hypothetical protein